MELQRKDGNDILRRCPRRSFGVTHKAPCLRSGGTASLPAFQLPPLVPLSHPLLTGLPLSLPAGLYLVCTALVKLLSRPTSLLRASTEPSGRRRGKELNEVFPSPIPLSTFFNSASGSCSFYSALPSCAASPTFYVNRQPRRLCTPAAYIYLPPSLRFSASSLFHSPVFPSCNLNDIPLSYVPCSPTFVPFLQSVLGRPPHRPW